MANILLVEDDATEGNIIRDFLLQGHHSVEYAPNGREALKQTRDFSFDLIVLDLGLPDFSGMEVLTTLRAEGLAVPVLILTGRNRSEEIISGLDHGVSGSGRLAC